MGQAFLPADQQPDLAITLRRLPHWRLDGSIYFITFRLRQGALSSLERRLVLLHVRAGHPQFYHLIAAVIMPDHAHVILKPHPGMALARIMKGMKGASSRLVNRGRGTKGSLWLDESWDRIVRNQKELLDKIDYMLHNPVKAGLVKFADEYEALYWSGETDIIDDD